MKDGIIKYDFQFTKTSPLDKKLWEETEKIREELFAMKLIGWKDGIGYGNISKREGEKSFVITGTQTGDKKSLDANDYTLVEDFEDEKFYLKSSGMIKPSSESLTHATIYNLDKDINAVIHIHSLNLWRFMLEGDYLKTKDVPYGSKEMIKEVKRIYQDIKPLENPKFVMSGHQEGIMVFGKSLRSALITLFEVIGDFIVNKNII